ncbi:hypothetical protein HAX54_051637, partial [Datura stramonium]|nr:hypothetical protein [Datura stramonium]
DRFGTKVTHNSLEGPGPQGDSSTAPVDRNTSVDTRTEDSPVDTSAGMAAPVGQPDSVLLPNTFGPSLVQNNDEEGTTEKGSMKTSYDYLFEKDLPVEKGISSNILAHGDQLIVQNDLSDDDQPLAWKVRKLVGRQHQQSSRDQVRPPTTRSSSRKLLSDALKENHQKTTQRRKLKRKMIIEDEPSIQPENILDPEDEDKEFEDEVLATMKKGKTMSQPTSRKCSTVTKRFPTKKIASSSRRRSGDVIAEDMPSKSVTSIKTNKTLHLPVKRLRDQVLPLFPSLLPELSSRNC